MIIFPCKCTCVGTFRWTAVCAYPQAGYNSLWGKRLEWSHGHWGSEVEIQHTFSSGYPRERLSKEEGKKKGCVYCVCPSLGLRRMERMAKLKLSLSADSWPSGPAFFIGWVLILSLIYQPRRQQGSALKEPQSSYFWNFCSHRITTQPKIVRAYKLKRNFFCKSNKLL